MPHIWRDISRFRPIILSLPSLATNTNTYSMLVRVTFHLSILQYTYLCGTSSHFATTPSNGPSVRLLSVKNCLHDQQPVLNKISLLFTQSEISHTVFYAYTNSFGIWRKLNKAVRRWLLTAGTWVRFLIMQHINIHSVFNVGTSSLTWVLAGHRTETFIIFGIPLGSIRVWVMVGFCNNFFFYCYNMRLSWIFNLYLIISCK